MKDKIKVVFLDIDGVVATERALNNELCKYFGMTLKELDDGTPNSWCESTGLPYPSVSLYHWPFDSKAIENLYRLQLVTKCKFVLSSSWRTGMNVDEINDQMATKGLHIKFIGKTDSLRGTRGEEIQKWINEHPDVIEQYVIIDDECSYDIIKDHPDNCVQTISNNGFTSKDLKKAIKILG